MRLDEATAAQRFAAARVARFATADGSGRPHVVPVTFEVVAGAVVFPIDHKPKSGKPLRRLRNIAANPAVSFLVDHYEDDWEELWWVRADAVATIVDSADRPEEVRALRGKYRQYADRPPAGKLVYATVTAWRGWSAKR